MPAKATPIGNNLPASQLAHVAVALRIGVILPAIRCTNHDANKTPAKRTKMLPIPFAETRAYVPKVAGVWQVARLLCITPPELISDGCVFATMQP